MTLKPLKLEKVGKSQLCHESIKYMQTIVCLIVDCHKTYTPIIRSYTFSKLVHPGIHRWCMTPFAVRKNVSKHKGVV